MTETTMQDELRGPPFFHNAAADRLDELETQNVELLKLVELVDAGADIIGKLEADKAELRVILEDCAAELEEYDASPSTSKIAMLARQTIAKHKP